MIFYEKQEADFNASNAYGRAEILSAQSTIKKNENGRKTLDGYGNNRKIIYPDFRDILSDWITTDHGTIERFLKDLRLERFVTVAALEDIISKKAQAGDNLKRFFFLSYPAEERGSEGYFQKTRLLGVNHFSDNLGLENLPVIDIPQVICQEKIEQLNKHPDESRKRKVLITARKAYADRWFFRAPYVATDKSTTIESGFYKLLRGRIINMLAARDVMANEQLVDKAVKFYADSISLSVWSIQGFAPLPSFTNAKETAAELMYMLYGISISSDSNDESPEYAEAKIFYETALAHFRAVKGIDVVGGIKYGYNIGQGAIMKLLRYNASVSSPDAMSYVRGKFKKLSPAERMLLCPVAKNFDSQQNILNLENISSVNASEFLVTSLLEYYSVPKEHRNAFLRLRKTEARETPEKPIKKAKNFAEALNIFVSKKFISRDYFLLALIKAKPSLIDDTNLEQSIDSLRNRINKYCGGRSLPAPEIYDTLLSLPQMDDASREIMTDLYVQRKNRRGAEDGKEGFILQKNLLKQNLNLPKLRSKMAEIAPSGKPFAEGGLSQMMKSSLKVNQLVSEDRIQYNIRLAMKALDLPDEDTAEVEKRYKTRTGNDLKSLGDIRLLPKTLKKVESWASAVNSRKAASVTSVIGHLL